MLEQLCAPALIYFVFSSTQVIIDFTRGMYNTALVKLLVTFVITILLNYLCASGLSVISWFIVFIPFILMTLIISILLFVFGLDPRTGKIDIQDESLYKQLNQQQQYPDPRKTHSTSDDAEKISKQRHSKERSENLPYSEQMGKFDYLFRDETQQDNSPLNRALSADGGDSQGQTPSSGIVKKKIGTVSSIMASKNVI